MSIRSAISNAANTLIQEQDISYTDLWVSSGLHEKELESLLEGKPYITIDEIERVFEEVFHTKLSIVTDHDVKGQYQKDLENCI